MANKNTKKEYFVDEAGDGNLFNKKGNIIIGQEGCSRYFLLGVLDVRDPKSLSTDFLALREQLLNDPYFKNVPSMQKESRKTYYSFHAKDDLPEVRREVFSLIKKHDLDDTRKAHYGCFYDKKRPLTRVAFDDNLPGI